jgi:hypothetical protein
MILSRDTTTATEEPIMRLTAYENQEGNKQTQRDCGKVGSVQRPVKVGDASLHAEMRKPDPILLGERRSAFDQASRDAVKLTASAILRFDRTLQRLSEIRGDANSGYSSWGDRINELQGERESS